MTDGSMDDRTECMGAGYVVGDAEAPLMTLSLRVGGPLASVHAEAASLLQLLRDVAGKNGRNRRLLTFIDCLVLLDIIRKWGTQLPPTSKLLQRKMSTLMFSIPFSLSCT